jgi:23S rRNA pseudouridine1911/1915/1917 synthase
MSVTARPGPQNEGYAYREQVGPAQAGQTVLAYLASRYRHSSTSRWRERLDGGEVSVDGRRADSAAVLRSGQVIVWARPPWREAEVPLGWALLHRDPHVLAVAKPAGLPTVPAGGFLVHTLLARLRAWFPEATPAHRLGRGTSGLVLFARTADAQAALARAWRECRVHKVYRARVTGSPREDAFVVEAPIGPVPHSVLGTVQAASAAGRRALSRVRVLRRGEGSALVEVEIETGRPHQIRIHLAAAGHPLIGDPLYGEGGLPRDDTAALPGDTGYALHAHRLALAHPATGAPLHLSCRPPRTLRLPQE